MMDRSFRSFWMLGAVTSCLLALTGCGREEAAEVVRQPAGTSGTSQAATITRPVQTELDYALVKTFESGLHQLAGITIDDEDRIYLAGSGGVRVLDAEGELLASWRTLGAARCVAVDDEGNVYVGQRARIEKFDRDGTLLTSWGTKGSGRGEFKVVTSISVSGANLFVADAGNRCIHRFATDGDFIDEIGKRDPARNFLGLICPSPYLDCAVDAEGVLHVTNPGKLRVEKYKLNGELVSFWGKAGMSPEGFCGCCNPTNIALMAGGRTVTAEKGIPRVKVYDTDGRMLAYLGPEYFSKGAAGMDLAVDSLGRIYVIDPGDGKVRVFALKE